MSKVMSCKFIEPNQEWDCTENMVANLYITIQKLIDKNKVKYFYFQKGCFNKICLDMVEMINHMYLNLSIKELLNDADYSISIDDIK